MSHRDPARGIGPVVSAVARPPEAKGPGGWPPAGPSPGGSAMSYQDGGRVTQGEECVADRLLEAREVAALLSVPERWVREHTRSGLLPHVSLGRYRRYDRDDVLRWVEQQKTGGVPTTFRKHRPIPRSGTQ